MRRLGELEAAVMAVLWSRSTDTTVREVHDALTTDRPLAYTTVLSVMDNLHSKGVLTRRRVGRAHAYAPAATREEHTAGLLESVLSETPDRGAALLHLVERLSPDELAALRAALDDEPSA